MASRRWPRSVAAVAAALVAALSVAGCVSMPSAGPVQAYPVTQSPNAQAQPYVQIVPGPPQPGWNPQQIVEGFLTASASFADNGQVARDYLTPQASAEWKPFSSWTADVYKEGPNPSPPVYSRAPKANPTAKASDPPKGKPSPPPQTAAVTITGKLQAKLAGNGSYATAIPSEPGPSPVFRLVNLDGQWRIQQAPPELLLTADSFANDYQLRNLYFFDPQTKYLVPDPVYVPLQATPASLMYGLVTDLIRQPLDWLANGTRTAFPTGTTLIGGVTLDGTAAVVNLGGAIAHASTAVKNQVSAQLISTLVGTGQGGQAVQSVEVQTNGKPFFPDNGQGTPVQTQSMYHPQYGASQTFYYLGAGETLYSQAGPDGKPVDIGKVDIGRTAGSIEQIAVSRDGDYLAVVTASGELWTGPYGGKLTKRTGSEYSSISWGPNDDLWATTNGQVEVLLPGNHLVQVQVSGPGNGNVTALEVAPDGVRVAMISGDDVLEFGAIAWQQTLRQPQPGAQIWVSPFSVETVASFETVTWYGPDFVITLANPGPTPSVTEYPVNGGNSTAIATVPDMGSISASWGHALIAGLPDGHMISDANLTGSWDPVTAPGTTTPVTGTSPVYPG